MRGCPRWQILSTHWARKSDNFSILIASATSSESVSHVAIAGVKFADGTRQKVKRLSRVTIKNVWYGPAWDFKPAHLLAQIYCIISTPFD